MFFYLVLPHQFTAFLALEIQIFFISILALFLIDSSSSQWHKIKEVCHFVFLVHNIKKKLKHQHINKNTAICIENTLNKRILHLLVIQQNAYLNSQSTKELYIVRLLTIFGVQVLSQHLNDLEIEVVADLQ